MSNHNLKKSLTSLGWTAYALGGAALVAGAIFFKSLGPEATESDADRLTSAGASASAEPLAAIVSSIFAQSLTYAVSSTSVESSSPDNSELLSLARQIDDLQALFESQSNRVEGYVMGLESYQNGMTEATEYWADIMNQQKILFKFGPLVFKEQLRDASRWANNGKQYQGDINNLLRILAKLRIDVQGLAVAAAEGDVSSSQTGAVAAMANVLLYLQSAAKKLEGDIGTLRYVFNSVMAGSDGFDG